jgi:hypothetical protein
MRGRSVEPSLMVGLMTAALWSTVAVGSTPAAKRDIERLERHRTEALHAGEGDLAPFASDAIDIEGDGRVSLAPNAPAVALKGGRRPDSTAPNAAVATVKRGAQPNYGALNATDMARTRRSGPAYAVPNAAVMTPKPASRPDNRLDALGVHVYGGAAVTTGRHGTIRFVRVWHREGDRWLVVASQTTPIESAPPLAPIVSPSRHRSAPVLGPPEREVWAATVAVADAARSRNLKAWTYWIADEFLGTSVDGRVNTKAARLAALGATAANGPAASYEDVRVRIYGGLSVTTWAVPGTPNRRLMAIAVKRHGRWQRVAAIATRVTAGGRP